MAIEPEVIEEPTRRFNPLLIGLLVVVLLAVFFFFVMKPLFFPAQPEETAAPPARTQRPVTVATPAPSPSAAPETFEVFESKDPFRPLVVAGAAGGTGTTAGGTTAGGTTSGGTTSGTSGSTSGSTAGTGAAGGAAPSGGQRIQLVDVFTDNGTTKAQVKVGSTVFTVAPGETFATNFKLLSISGNCATLLHGDDKFTLCEGEEVFK